jgi:C4-dicarboxylate-specific signal transduction histidine kinase
VTSALRDLSQELEAVASCFNLVAGKARPLRERIGLSLARVGVERSIRAFQALRVLLEDPPPEHAAVSLSGIMDHTVRSFAEELRLNGVRIAMDMPEAVVRVTGDAWMLSLALQACLGTLVSLVEASNAPDAIHVGARVSDGIVSCDMRQDAFRLSADQFSRLADLEWAERPGGSAAGIGLAAAARIAQAHGGTLDARRTEAGGCVLVLTVRE